MLVPMPEFVRTHRIRSLRIAGLLLFLIAFALPAVRVGTRSSVTSDSLPGWDCAHMAAMSELEVAKMAFLPRSPAQPAEEDHAPLSFTLLLAASGLINPLTLAQCFPFARGRRWVAWLLAGAVATCMVCTWALFVLMHIWPLIGHILWIAGAVMTVAANLMPQVNRAAEVGNPAE
jgi:hypothetical protein